MLLKTGLRERSLGYRGRFAPSPTGPLHRGNLRTALLSWLDARIHGGEWILRFDDLDRPRCRAGAEESILADLRWLGLDWNGPIVRQGQRRGIYASVLSALRQSGLLYPCGCSRRMLADVSAPHGAWGVYPGTCRLQHRAWGAPGSRPPSWRLRLGRGSITWPERSGAPGWRDAAGHVGDVVLRRADGVVAYHLATAVDEGLLGISDVVRGDDLWESTAAQVAVMATLGMPPPRYAHVPLWRDAVGERLSKRSGSEGLEAWRSRGHDGQAVIGLLAASVGLVDEGSRLSARELVEQLNADTFERALLNAGTYPSDAR